MSETTAIFTLDCIDIKIQCKNEEKMKDICQRFAIKIEKNMNSYIHQYTISNMNKLKQNIIMRK